MSPDTQEKITNAISRLCTQVGQALGRDSVSYSEVMQGLRPALGNHLVRFLTNRAVSKVVRPEQEVLEHLDEASSHIDTEEKFKQLLLSLPEPSPEELDQIVQSINGMLPGLRKFALQVVKALPHDPGGAPKKLSSIEEQKRVVEDIKGLWGPGVKLNDIFMRVAQRYGVSSSKIKQIWQSWAKRSSPDTDAK